MSFYYGHIRALLFKRTNRGKDSLVESLILVSLLYFAEPISYGDASAE